MTQVLGVKICYWPQNVKLVLKLMRKVYTVLKQILVLCRKISQKYQIGKPKIKWADNIRQGVRRFERFEFLSEKINFAAQNRPPSNQIPVTHNTKGFQVWTLRHINLRWRSTCRTHWLFTKANNLCQKLPPLNFNFKSKLSNQGSWKHLCLCP